MVKQISKKQTQHLWHVWYVNFGMWLDHEGSFQYISITTTYCVPWRIHFPLPISQSNCYDKSTRTLTPILWTIPSFNTLDIPPTNLSESKKLKESWMDCNTMPKSGLMDFFFFLFVQTKWTYSSKSNLCSVFPNKAHNSNIILMGQSIQSYCRWLKIHLSKPEMPSELPADFPWTLASWLTWMASVSQLEPKESIKDNIWPWFPPQINYLGSIFPWSTIQFYLGFQLPRQLCWWYRWADMYYSWGSPLHELLHLKRELHNLGSWCSLGIYSGGYPDGQISILIPQPPKTHMRWVFNPGSKEIIMSSYLKTHLKPMNTFPVPVLEGI